MYGQTGDSTRSCTFNLAAILQIGEYHDDHDDLMYGDDDYEDVDDEDEDKECNFTKLLKMIIFICYQFTIGYKQATS